MKSRFYGISFVWREEFFCLLALSSLLLALCSPAPVLAQAKDPLQYKIFKADEFVKMENPNPKQPYRLEILTNPDDAKDLGGIFGIRTPAAPGSKVTYHYHKNRESILFIVGGQGLEMVEGKAIPVKAGDLIFIRPGVKHTLVNNTDKDLKYIEFFTYPPVMSDFIEVKE